MTSADPSTYHKVSVPLGPTYYVYDEIDLGLPISVPGSGFLLGNKTAVFQEENGVDGLQRGGLCGYGIQHNLPRSNACVTGDWFPPGCDQNWEPSHLTLPCIIIDDGEDIWDEHCEHGPDWVII